jgi:hypothetical protein
MSYTHRVVCKMSPRGDMAAKIRTEVKKPKPSKEELEKVARDLCVQAVFP